MKYLSGSLLLLLAGAFHISAQTKPSNGYQLVTINGKYGYLNAANHLVIPAQFDLARPFSDGMAAVAFSTDSPSPQSDCSCRAVITSYHFKWGFINETGELVIEPQWGNVGDFSEGLAGVSNGQGFSFGKWGYINKAGVLAIRHQFDHAEPFVNGKALFTITEAVKGRKLINMTKGYVDRKGKRSNTFQKVYRGQLPYPG
jgi:WG containing repeat